MKIIIEAQGKEYTIGFTKRKTYYDMTSAISELVTNKENGDLDVDMVITGSTMLTFALTDYNTFGTPAEKESVVKEIMSEYPMTDCVDEETNETVEGLITLIHKMSEDVVPSGFTGKANKRFKVIR